MGNALDKAAEILWAFVERRGGWWTPAAITEHWQPTFSESEVRARLEALRHGNFLTRRPFGTAGDFAYAFALGCSRLPGVRPMPSGADALAAIPSARQTSVMSRPVYRTPAGPVMRPGALAANSVPSLQMGRRVYRGGTA